MRTERLRFVLFLLLACGLARAVAAEPAVGPHRLVRNVDDALAGVAEAARRLDAKNPPNAAFLNALAGLRLRVSHIEESLTKKNGEFYLLVDQGSTDLGQLRVAWARTGSRNEPIAEGLRIASSSYRLLRSSFGREGIRHAQGGTLSGPERRQFLRLRRAQLRFAANLQDLRDQARRRGDAATAAELERFRAEAWRIAQAALDLESYLNALIATSELRGEWQANAPYIKKTAPPQRYAEAGQTVEDLYVDSDIGEVFTVDLGKPGDAAVEYLQPGEETLEAVEPAEPVETGVVITEPAGEAVEEPAEIEETAAVEVEPEEAEPAEDLPEAVEPAEAGEPAPEEVQAAHATPTPPAADTQAGQTAKKGPEAKEAAPATPPAAPPPPATRPKTPPIG
ncbi:MAG: hypothetical protein ACJ75H_07845 [Thermoanaerobaculia bacterium]